MQNTLSDIIKDEVDKYQTGADKSMEIQPWEIMQAVLTPAEFVGFLKGSILKYSLRAGKKPGSDDEKKARYYMEKLEQTSPW